MGRREARCYLAPNHSSFIIHPFFSQGISATDASMKQLRGGGLHLISLWKVSLSQFPEWYTVL